MQIVKLQRITHTHIPTGDSLDVLTDFQAFYHLRIAVSFLEVIHFEISRDLVIQSGTHFQVDLASFS